MDDSPRIGIVGGNGWIGGALARALVGTGVLPASRLTLSCRSAPPGWLPEATWTHDNQALADASDVVVLSVRPQDWPQVTLAAPGKQDVVLMVHGGFGPSIVAYDLRYRDYSFMAQLARAGFDVFTMSHTGYAPSPRPLMDDPHNVDAEFQPLLVPHVLAAPVPPRYPYKLVSSRTEWDELETVVSYIKQLRGVDRVSLVGLDDLTPGKPVTCMVRHADGTTDMLSLQHSYAASQIAWFRRGSALNLFHDKVGA